MVVLPTVCASPHWANHNITAPGVHRSCPIGHHQHLNRQTTTTTPLHLFLSLLSLSFPRVSPPHPLYPPFSPWPLSPWSRVSLYLLLPKQSTPIASPPRHRFLIAVIAKQQQVNSFVFGILATDHDCLALERVYDLVLSSAILFFRAPLLSVRLFILQLFFSSLYNIISDISNRHGWKQYWLRPDH